METLISIFREVRDPRDFNAQHDLAAMLFVALAATLCGAKSCVDIADFVAANESELAEIVDLRHGPPSHDSFSRLFRLLDPQEVAKAFARFVTALREGLGIGPAKGVVAVDGKRLRRGYERGRSHMPPLMVSVWDADTRLSLAAQAAPDGNEVAATLAVLKSLVLKGCTVVGDALHCHPRMAAQVRQRGAHYALKLKANHAPLFACAAPAFLPSRPMRRTFPISPPLAALRASVRPTARSCAKCTMWPCPNGCRPNACSKWRERIGVSKTSFIGASTLSSMKMMLEPARTT